MKRRYLILFLTITTVLLTMLHAVHNKVLDYLIEEIHIARLALDLLRHEDIAEHRYRALGSVRSIKRLTVSLGKVTADSSILNNLSYIEEHLSNGTYSQWDVPGFMASLQMLNERASAFRSRRIRPLWNLGGQYWK